MSSRNKRDRERDKRGTGDAKSDGSKEDGPTLSNGISADSPPRNASSKETSTSVGAGGKDDSDEKSNEANRDDVADIIRNSTDPKMATLRAEYEALLQGTHDDFLAACRKLELTRNMRIKAAEKLRDLQIHSISEQCQAEKKEAEDAFAEEQQKLRENMLQQLLERHKHDDRGGWDDSSDSRMLTRKMRRRSDGLDSKMEKHNFQQGTIKRKLSQLSVSLSLKSDEVTKDISDIQKAIQAGAVANHNLNRPQTSSASSGGYSAYVDNGKLIFNDAHFDKGDSVIVTHMHLPTSRGTIQNINNSEVCVKCADGSKTRVYLSHLRTGRCSIAAASDTSSQRSRR